MSRVLVIGCGGVASVAIHKICQVSEVFSDLCIASRTVSKCDKLADELKGKTSTNITTAKVDADNTDEVIALINEFKPDVLHVKFLMLILLITSVRIQTILSGERYMRRDASVLDLQHILTTHGSGLTEKNIKKLELQHF